MAGLSPASGLRDDVRPFDLVWLIHLVDDAHQPLRATARLSHDLPAGDEGSNQALVVPATGETISMHAYRGPASGTLPDTRECGPGRIY